MQINETKIFFPHETIRDIQKVLVLQILNVIQNKQNLIVHAPTGCGKTASALSSALTFAIQNNKTVIFVTPMHSQHKIAVDTLKLIRKKYNLDFKATDFIGKKWMCLQSNAQEMSSSEFSEFCSQFVKNDLCDFYLNFKDNTKKELALNELKEIKHVEELITDADKHKLCPFEIAGENAKRSKVIVADYFHVLSPSIREAFFKRINKDIENCIIIFDEAHNLISKCRDLLSSSLSSIIIERAIKEAQEFNLEIHEELNSIRNTLMSLSSNLNLSENEKLIKKENFLFEDNLIIKLKALSEIVLEKEEKKKSYIQTIANFLAFWKGEDFAFVRSVNRSFFKGKPYYNIVYKCLDPSIIFSKLKPYSTILMSGTLTPQQMYIELLGVSKTHTVTAEYKNPFPKNNKLALIIPKTSTKYTDRSDFMYKNIAQICAEISNKIPGNTLIFFPSYDLRDKINEFFKEKCEKTTFLEYPSLSKQEKQDLLEKFKENKEHGAVLMATSSGSFGEGIDLIGDFLKCVIVVGLPLAKPDLETKECINYYDKKFSRGWDYAYIYPAIIKTIQNAGRCIRSENDKGVVIFLDERYQLQNYKKCFPPDYNFEITLDYLNKIKDFFKQ